MGCRRALGMPHGKPGRTKPRGVDELQCDGNDPEGRQHEHEVAPIRVEQIGPHDLRERCLTGEGDRGKNGIEGGRETQGHDGQVYAAQAQRRQADGDADRNRCQTAGDHPHNQSTGGGDEIEIPRDPGSDTGKRHLA